jgi:LysM repeat protein
MQIRGRLKQHADWMAPVAGLSLGAALAVWVFLSWGYQPVAAPEAVPAEAGASEPTLSQPEAPALAIESTSTDASESPFAHIAEPPPQPARRSGLVTHTVAPGEVLWQIAEQYNLRPETLLWANDVPDPDLILAGQQLLVPPQDGVLYTVRPGDRLVDVAARYGIDVDEIVSSNALSDADQIQAGVDIFLPGARPLAPTLAAGGTSSTAHADNAAEQAAAEALAPVPLPDNINELLDAAWLRTRRDTSLYKTADFGSRVLDALPAGVRLERLGGFRRGRIELRDPGDGHTRQAMTGWVDATDLLAGRAPASRELPQAYPADTAMDISHVFAPYRSQLDGSPYAEANCGPTAVGIAMSALGVDVPSRQLRAEALNAQHMWGNGVGTLLTALAAVVEAHGLSALDVYAAGGGLHRWSLDEIRAHIQQGHPVVVQVRYRSLPGRGGAYYFGDHYIVLVGVVAEGFLYNDPMDFDGIGWDRVMSADRLRTAMNASDQRYAYTAFAVGP